PSLSQPRAPTSMNQLHMAAFRGLVGGTRSILQGGSIDVDEVDSKGYSPLMYAALRGHSRVVEVLLNKRANVSIVGHNGSNALHTSARYGHVTIVRMLLRAGADTEIAVVESGLTALHLAAHNGHSEVMEALMTAGASVDRRSWIGQTALCAAALAGQVGALKKLLAANANPLLCTTSPQGQILPLDAAALHGRSGVVREMIGHLGVEGCGGLTGGANALRLAAEEQHLDIIIMLTHAGVADDGSALRAAALLGDVEAVKLLLRQHRGKPAGGNSYVNAHCPKSGRIPLMACVLGSHPGCPRVLRTLLDAGADSTAFVPTLLPSGNASNFTPLEMATEVLLRGETVGVSMTKEQLRVLARTRSVLMREEAIHAVSWLWPAD
ncbi:unnamed protein product, partial [Scytosiphon promiscuus]